MINIFSNGVGLKIYTKISGVPIYKWQIEWEPNQRKYDFHNSIKVKYLGVTPSKQVKTQYYKMFKMFKK